MGLKPAAQFALDYLRNKDLVYNRIAEVQELDDMSFAVRYTNKEVFARAVPHIEDLDAVLTEIGSELGERHPLIIVLNTKNNVTVITKGFKKLVDFHKYLQLLVINPFSQQETKWIIFPWTHSRVADPESLALGIKAMSDTVDFITASQEKELA